MSVDPDDLLVCTRTAVLGASIRVDHRSTLTHNYRGRNTRVRSVVVEAFGENSYTNPRDARLELAEWARRNLHDGARSGRAEA